MALLAFMCLGVAVKGFSQFDISKTTLKVDWQMNAPFSTLIPQHYYKIFFLST